MRLADQIRAFGGAPPMSTPCQFAYAKQRLMHEGEVGDHCYLVVHGVLRRSMPAPNGKRQIVGFHVAGDICGNAASATEILDYSIEALSDVTFVPIQKRSLLDLIKGSRLLGCALRRHIDVDAAISRQWIVNLGQRSAYYRLAYLICEIEARLQAVGLAENGVFPWRCTQSDFGAAAGLSLVHTNKTLGLLEREGFAEWCNGVVRIGDIARLRRLVGFDPTYLSLDQPSLGRLLLAQGAACFDAIHGDRRVSRSDIGVGIGRQTGVQSGARRRFGPRDSSTANPMQSQSP